MDREEMITILAEDMMNPDTANRSLLTLAKFLMYTGPTPDWVMVLANGDLENWQSVIEIARDDFVEGGNDNKSVAG